LRTHGLSDFDLTQSILSFAPRLVSIPPSANLKLTMKNCLRELRAERGWSQGDLAQQLSVSRQTVNAIETEKYDPSLPLALKIAKLFRRPVEAIFAE